MKTALKNRFLKYVSFDTQSDPDSLTFPSTAKQLSLLTYLMEEMIAIGAQDVEIDPHGYVTGTIPPSEGYKDKPVIGFLAHVDTSPDMVGSGVKPQIIEHYDGTDIALNETTIMHVADFPELACMKGHTLITTDGTTLLGADDKAGIAEIMTAAEYLLTHPDIPHGKIRIAFTPDEEVGRGVDFFDVDAFGAQFAYTIDGGFEGELEYENFNAASAKITINGRNIHPGYAKNKMLNAIHIAQELNSMLPAHERPEHTEGYEGFFHLNSLICSVENASMEYIIRDFERESFECRKDLIRRAVNDLNHRYGEGTIELTLTDQYYNMREMIDPHPQVIEKAKEAIKQAGAKPLIRPIRGGTDGARLSFMGLPCPNIFTGGMNFHGKYEYCSLDVMHKAVHTIINLAREWAQ